MKKSVILCSILIVILSACGTQSHPDELDEWLINANLDAEESKEELYEKALEEDVLTVYSVSTRMMEVAELFEEEYPGLLVEVVDLRGETLINDARTTIENGEFDCDILFMTDVNGTLKNEFLPKGYAHKYVPYDMADKMIASANEDLLPLFTEAIFIHYNPSLFPEQPVNNWWELTDERWKDKVYVPNPMQSVTTLAMFSMFLKNSDLMEEAYELHYGEEFVSENGENASETFIRKLVKNGLHIVNSSDEVSDALGLENSEEALGWMVSSKLRLKKIGYELEFATNVEPFDGVASSVNIMIAGGAKNINSAKLFVRFIFGETDGAGVGYLPYLQEGVWSMRTDVTSEEDKNFEDLNLINSDEAYTYQNREEFYEFWDGLMQ